MPADIRPAQPADLADLQRLNDELFQSEHSFAVTGYALTADWSHSKDGLEYLTKCCAGTDGFQAFVAHQEGWIIGYLSANVYSESWMAANPVAEIDNLFVEAAHRRHGAASGLMAAFKAWAKAQGARRLKVEGLTANHPAMAFYARHGFHNVQTVLEQQVD